MIPKKLPLFSTGGKVVFIISLFVLILVLLGGMFFWYDTIFDGVRAYVRGEGLWAKAQKDAVSYLGSYSYNHSESDYHRALLTGSLEAFANPIPSPGWAATNSSYCSKTSPAGKRLKKCSTLLSIQYVTLTGLMITISKLASASE